ncbi:dynein intermediate chain 3, ciliary [Neocloeon triangulifer]|uniref:dynein intermediate chain 3, ciliary n=1 Tax=Neocloeon triangulifer TaxID=2078957 RepID=UPI00286FAEED|nr:dynein intermediate chain 3, ciliary [Neocloeon triangulifer]
MSSSTDQLQYIYSKRRREFGRRCSFKRNKTTLQVTLPTDLEYFRKNYILTNPVHCSAQTNGGDFSECDQVNTARPEFDDRGMNHVEGGWPKDLNPADPEQTLRFRKKVEKDEKYIHAILQLSHAVEHCILQNNALDIYETHLEAEVGGVQVEPLSARGLNVFQDPCHIKRPVHHISWAPDGGTRLAVSHCSLAFQHASHSELSSQTYIWHVEKPNQPDLTFRPPSAIVCLEYNQKDPNVLVSGFYDGRVACWDTRKGPEPVEMSPLEPSHRDPVHKALWMNSKTGTEFFSASTDGQVMWWDTRKLSEPSEVLILDPVKGQEQSLSRALGAVSLEYEPTIPTRFMVGTEMGVVINCNRKGKTPPEKMVCQYAAHLGPVYALQRNPAFVKNFLSVGDWSARVWSEDVRESSIISTGLGEWQLTDGCWSPTKFSAFYTTREDGRLDAWDLLQQRHRPVLSVKVCDATLRSIRAHEQGQLLAVGSDTGATYLYQVSDHLVVPHKNDKPMFTEMLERETRREKIVEARRREKRLKGKVRGDEGRQQGNQIRPSTEPLTFEQLAEDPLIAEAERHYFEIVQSLQDQEQKKEENGEEVNK